MTPSVRPCPICGGGAAPAFQAGEHRMYRCLTCATAFVDPLPDNAALERFYAQFHLSDAEGGSYDRFEDRMRADFAAKVAKLKSFACREGSAGRVLDVGCGKGFFVKACTEVGIAAEGIDLSETAVRFAVGHLGVRATAGNLSGFKDRLGSFDAVTFWATIEHLSDPMAMLRDIHEVLKPGGLLLLDTGIGHDWLDRLLPGRVQWYDPPQHLFVFSANGMRRALNATGFSLIHADWCFERSEPRRWVRILRNAVTGVGLRGAAAAGRLRPGPFEFTRFPVGNLMSIVARRKATPPPSGHGAQSEA